MQRRKITNIKNNATNKSNIMDVNNNLDMKNDLEMNKILEEMNNDYKNAYRKVEYNMNTDKIPKTKESVLFLEKGKNLENNGIKYELLQKDIERKRYEEILKNKRNINVELNTNESVEGVKNGVLENNSSVLELVNTANMTNNLLSNISLNLGISNKNPNNISNVNNGHKDFIFEFDSKYRNRNLPSKFDPNVYFSFSLANIKSSDNIYLGNIGVGYPLENVIEMEINSITIPNILKDYDETIRKKKINVQIMELIDKNVIETSSISEWKDKHFIFEINQYIEYNNVNQMVINDNYLKLVPVVNKIRFPSPVTKLDKLTFIFSLEDTPLVFSTDLIIGDLSMGPLTRTNVYTELAHNLSVNDLIVISDDRTSRDLLNTYPKLNNSEWIVDPNINNNLALSNQFPEEGVSLADPNSEFANSNDPITSFYYIKSNMSTNQPNPSSVFKIKNIIDYSNLMLYQLGNISKNMSNLYYKMMINNLSDYFKLILNSREEFKVSNVVDENNFNFLINSYSFFTFTDKNDLNYSATLANIESIILIIDSLNTSNKKNIEDIARENAVLTENQYLYTRNNLSLFNINKELYSYNDNQVITIKVSIINNNIYFDENLVTEYILYNNNIYIFDQSDSSNLNNKLEFSTTKPTEIVGDYIPDEFKTLGGLNVSRYNIAVDTPNANPKYNGIAGVQNGNTTLEVSNVLIPNGTELYCFTENLRFTNLEIKLVINDPVLPNYRNILVNDIVDKYKSVALPLKVQQEYPDETNNDPTETYAEYIKNITLLEKYIKEKDLLAIEAAQNGLSSAKQNTSSASTTLSDYRMHWGLVSNLYNNSLYFIKMLNIKKLELYLLKYDISYLQLENSAITENNQINLYITVESDKYYINNNRVEELVLYINNTYIFDLSDSKNLGVGTGFKFSESVESGEYIIGVDDSKAKTLIGTSGSCIKLTITEDTPSILYIYSSLKTGMGLVLKIRESCTRQLNMNILNLTSINDNYSMLWNNILLDTKSNIFSVKVLDNRFYVNNVDANLLILNLVEGATYEFDLTDVSLIDNNVIFRLCYSEDGNTYDDNVVLTETGLKITVNGETPRLLYYKNVNMNGYGGKILVCENNGLSSLSQMGKKNQLMLFRDYYTYLRNEDENSLKKLELFFKNDKDILEKTKDYNMIKNIIQNHYKANVSNFNIANYNPEVDISLLKENIKKLQNDLPEDFGSYADIMNDYEKTKNDLLILLEDLGNRKYNIMESNNTFIWTEYYNNTSQNLASSLREGSYTIYELIKEIEYILNKDSPNRYVYLVNIDYNNLADISNNLHRVKITCKISEAYDENLSNGFKLRFDLSNLYDILFSTFNINFQNSPSSDYSYYNGLSVLTANNTLNVINKNNVIKRPIQLGETRKVLTVYTELNNSISGQDIICLLREFDPSNNDYNTLTRLKLKSLNNDISVKNVYISNLDTVDGDIYYSLIIVQDKIYLVSVDIITGNMILMEEKSGLVNFNGDVDKNYEPIYIKDNNINNTNKILLFYDIASKKFKSLIIDVNASGSKISLGSELLITGNLSNTLNMGSVPLTMRDLSSAVITEVSGVLKIDDYQHIWALTIIENGTTYSTILCHMMYVNNVLTCMKSSYIGNYSGINDSTAFFMLADNTFIWVGKNYYVRNINEVYENKKIKMHIVSLSTNNFILNNSDNTILNEVNDKIGNGFVLDVITGRKLSNNNKFYLVQSNYYFNSESDYNKSIKLLLLNYDSLTYSVSVEKSFSIKDENASAESVYYYLFGNNTNSMNAYYNPQILFYFSEYNIHHWYCTCKYDNPIYKNYISFVMVDDLISDPLSTRFTLDKTYFGELKDNNQASVLGLSYTSSKSIFDLLYYNDVNYNMYSLNLATDYEILCKLNNYKDNLTYYNDYLKTLNIYINLKDYIVNYGRNNNLSYAAIENILMDIIGYYDSINNYTQKIYRLETNISELKEYNNKITENITLINNWNDELNRYNLRYTKNTNRIYMKQIELTNGNNLLNKNALISTDVSIDTLINYYKNYIKGGKDELETEFNGYLEQIQTLNTEIKIYANYVDPNNSNTTSDSILGDFIKALGQAQSDYNYHISLLNDYKNNLNILLNKIYNTSTNQNYKLAAQNFLLNNDKYEKTIVNKTQILSIINNLSTQILDSKNKIANYEFNKAKNDLDLINNNKFLLDLNHEVFNKLLTKWMLSKGNDNIFNRIYIQNLTIPNIPFYIANRRFQITLRLRVLNDTPTQGILNI